MITPRLRIGWTNTCNFTGPYDDVSADVRDIRFKHGFPEPYFSRIAAAGELEVILDNSENNQWGITRFYSPSNTASPLYPYLIPNRPVTLDFYKDGVWYNKWQGWLATVEDFPDPRIQKTTIRAFDSMEPLMHGAINMPIQVDIRTDELAEEILSRAAIPRAICGDWVLGVAGASELGVTTVLAAPGTGWALDIGAVTFSYAGDWPAEGIMPYDALRETVRAEWGRVYANPVTGEYTFHNQSWEIVNNIPDATITDDELLSARPDSSNKRIKNKVTVTITPRAVGSPGTTIAALQTVPGIDSGETLDLELPYRDETGGNRIGALSVDGYTVTGNTKADGTGVDRSVNLVVTFTEDATRSIAHVQNTYSKTVYVTELTVTGTPLHRYDAVGATARDEDSIGAYFEQAQEVILYLGDDCDFAMALAQTLLSLFSSPVVHIDEITLVNLNDTCEDLLCGLSLMSLIRLNSTLLDTDESLRIIQEACSITDGGCRIETTFSLERSNWVKYWILGDPVYGLLGVTTIVGPF